METNNSKKEHPPLFPEHVLLSYPTNVPNKKAKVFEKPLLLKREKRDKITPCSFSFREPDDFILGRSGL
jgi:hypothetical protein